MEMPYRKALQSHFRFLKVMGNHEQFKPYAVWKDKHINIETDSAILKQLHAAVHDQLQLNRFSTAALLFLKFIFYFSADYFVTILFLLQHNLFLYCSVILALDYFQYCWVLILHTIFSHNTIFKNKNAE